MPRVLTVDDSRAIRTIVGKQLAEMGFEFDEAEDGVLGLAKLDEVHYDLVILDITMPNLDGPGMLAKMREAGNKTPVIMLTSESKRSIMVDVMKSGIEDYILKPFKPEELKAKVLKVLRAPPAGGGQPEAAAPAAGRPEASGRQFVDIFVIDDMENVHKKLKTMIPPHVSVASAASAAGALSACREKVFRVIFLDTDIPDVNSAALMNQLRTLQQHTAFVALAIRTNSDKQHQDLLALGYDDVLFKPFDKDSIDDFLIRFFNDQDLVSVDENVIKVGKFTGKEDRLDRYFQRVSSLIEDQMEKLAAACFDDFIVDISNTPVKSDRTPRFVLHLKAEAVRRGMSMKVVATDEVRKILQAFDETSKLPIAPSVAEAQSAAAAA